MEILNWICRYLKVAPSLVELRGVTRSLISEGHVEITCVDGESKLRIRQSGLSARLAMLREQQALEDELLPWRRHGSTGEKVPR